MLTTTIGQILYVILDAVWLLIFVQFILSLLIAFNVINTRSEVVRSLTYALDSATDPIYSPIRRVVPAMGGIDWSPAIVLVLIRILNIIVHATTGA